VISWLDQEKRGRGQKGLSESQVHVDPRSWVLCGEETAQGAKRTSHISYRVSSGRGMEGRPRKHGRIPTQDTFRKGPFICRSMKKMKRVS
ncbi:hypothetical protein CapIbe_024155, partial [Capra ibex]